MLRLPPEAVILNMFAVNLPDNKTKEDLIEELKQVFEGMGYTFVHLDAETPSGKEKSER